MNDTPKLIVPLHRWRFATNEYGAFTPIADDKADWVKAEDAQVLVTAYNKLKDILTAFKADAEKTTAEHDAQVLAYDAQVAELRGIVGLLREDNKRLAAEQGGFHERLHALDENNRKLLFENIELYNWKLGHETDATREQDRLEAEEQERKREQEKQERLDAEEEGEQHEAPV